ncbi:MAG: heavy metal-associated domain-containing protein [Myxococcota bacterium]
MIKLAVRGMTCNHCVMAVTKALGTVQGVERVVEVSLARGEALVEGTPDVQSLAAAVDAAGYQASVVS